MKRKRLWWRALIVVCISIAIIVSSTVLFANDIKIGIVNTDKILRESAPAIAAQKKIEQEFLPRDEQVKKMMASTKALQEKLEKEGTGMTEEGRRDMERTLANQSREYQRAQRQLREDLSVRQNEEFGLILEYANKAINRIAETENYDLILQLQDSVYRSERIDITGQVIKALENQ